MPNSQDYNNLTEQEKKAIADAMAASNPMEAKANEVKTKAAHDAFDAYKDEVFAIVKNLDKSAYATVLDNDRVSQNIIRFLKNSTISNISYKSQLTHFENIVKEHKDQALHRNQIMRKKEEEGEASLTDTERNTLTAKTQLETMLEHSTKAYFENERAEFLKSVKREIENYERQVISAPDRQSPEALKKSIAFHLNGFGKAWARGKETTIYKFSERDLPKFVFDNAALDQYVNSYDKYIRANMESINKKQNMLSLGSAMYSAGNDFLTMGRDPQYEKLSDEEFNELHDRFEKKYNDAKERYDNYVKEVESDPAYKAHLNSPEYLNVVNLEYYERKYEGKSFEQIPDYEKPIYVAHKHEYVNGMGLHRIPAEERALFDKGVMIQAMPRVLEMEANLDHVEKTMARVWDETRNTAEQPFQKKELEENRAILSAYKKYLTDGSKESQQKFYDEVNKAYDNAKQNFKDNPDMRARFDVRSEQLLKGDFTFVPMMSRKDAKHYGMTANWDKHTYTREQISEMKDIPKTDAEKQYERAFSVHVTPLGRKALDYEIEQEVQNRPEYTLKEMGQSLQGADLEDYKATIHNDKMEKFNEFADALNAEIKTTKDILKSLPKHYGFFERLFSPHYKGRKMLLENDLAYGRKKYETELKKTKYDIYKTYQEKGLAFTRAEKKEFDAIVKEATRNGNIKGWDEERAAEKKKLDEFNAKWLENEEPEYNEEYYQERTVIQLDLSDRIHTSKQQEQPVKDEAQIAKEKETEQKIQEEQDLEK